MPRDRSGECSTALFERYARSEKALVAALAEMYVQGVCTRKVKAITEELCGHSFSARAISSISDDHAGLKKAIREALTEAGWQRCDVHFLRNALDYLPRKADDDCLQELRWIYDRRDIQEAHRDSYGLDRQVSGQVSEAGRLGGIEHCRDAHFLPPAARPSQAHEEHEQAGITE